VPETIKQLGTGNTLSWSWGVGCVGHRSYVFDL
jgi:hypothetical protein